MKAKFLLVLAALAVVAIGCVRTLNEKKTAALPLTKDRMEGQYERPASQVFEAAKPPKSFYIIEGADHNNTYQVGGAAYFRRWAEFVQASIRS